MKKFKAAVVGIGFIGIAHIEALRRLGYVDVVAISDPNIDLELANKLGFEFFYKDYKDLINNHDLDFIHICTPNNLHYEMTSYALNKDINVVLEKPMTYSLEEAKKLVQLLDSKKLTAGLNFHNRMFVAVNHMKNKIKSDELGEITMVFGNYLQDWLLLETDYSWRLINDESGDTRTVADIGSHILDLIQYVTNLKITEVSATFKTIYPKRIHNNKEILIDSEDLAIVNFKLENGALGSVNLSQMYAGKKNDIKLLISGTKASLEWGFQDLENLYMGHREKPNEVIFKDPILMKDAKDYMHFPPGHIEGLPDAFKNNFQQIYQKSLNPDLKTGFSTFKEGYQIMLINDAIKRSVNSKTWEKVKGLD